MRRVSLSEDLKNILTTLSVRDRALHDRVLKKIDEIVNGPDHYKNLRYDLKDYKRVHIGHFVLVFKYMDDCVYFSNLKHHNYIYK